MSDEVRTGVNMPPEGLKISGKVPPAMREALKMVRQEQIDQSGAPLPSASDPNPGGKPQASATPKLSQVRQQGSAQLEDLIAGIRDKSHVYEEIVLPSRGYFYNGKDGPTDGKISIRPMTGEEEQILATPRFVRKGQAVNMIFQRCIKEHFRSEEFLSADRTYLLIYLRGISYGSEYEVEVKDPETDRKFPTTINLDQLHLNACPDNYRPPLSGVMPKSGYRFNYRLSRGRDETAVQDYRERSLKMFGDTGADDTLLYRTALLLEDVEGLKEKTELVMLLKKLPIQDVSYVRNLVSDPPFGVDTKVSIYSPYSMEEFDIELPLEANFFFPRQRKKKEDDQTESA